MGILEILRSSSCEEIQKFCEQRFSNNMTFFAEYYPHLITPLQQPANDYRLYIGKEGINIIDVKNNTLVYDIVDGKSMMLDISEDLAYNPPINKKWDRYFGSETSIMGDEFRNTAKMCNGLLEFVTNNKATTQAYHLPNGLLPSITMLGLGGGIALQILAENYFIHSFLIFEENLDMFRIACFFIDFPLLFVKTNNNSGYMFIESLINREAIISYFALRRFSACAIRFELAMYNTPTIQSVKDIIYEAHSLAMRGWGTFEDEIIGVTNKKATKTSRILIEPKRVNAPICVVGNGPSLDSLLPFIKDNKDKMIIFSCGTALKPLLNYGIKPDFQIEIERHDYLDKVLLEAPLDDIPLLCASVLNKNAKEVAKELYIFEREGSAAAALNRPKFQVGFAAPFVGNAGAALAAYLGSDVLLCGIDCGYKKGSTKHAKGSHYGEEKAEIPEDAYRVDGNFSDDIYSDSLFSLSRATLEEAFARLSPFNVLNLSDGAYIKGAKPTLTDEFELKKINKKQEIKNLKSLFGDPSEIGFYSKDDKIYMFEILAFKRHLSDMFKQKITNKKDLFNCLDRFIDEIVKVAKRDDFITILFGGSISHFLYTIALVALHIPSDNILPLWKKAGELFDENCEKMIAEFRETLKL
ncbi:6-hydroxymethylpterin diphosphokinase MptE-like protein [Helicobacter sp. WB40]|uniref:6-hydroxymethylpterin diphosphokinase MptE-like protein n=1 Tax=Helicobacter sp. WB40 TaxID=3004130 RepID=UPI0022EC103B|nr:6-hydroxymethylpterin diphosphokinase MptE-like protein [Helicobacter sp. WB40]MDA3967245.1 DUF115 domain-containing protein [Helicobacter sp. WB40]